jgi:hypothetical protein
MQSRYQQAIEKLEERFTLGTTAPAMASAALSSAQQSQSTDFPATDPGHTRV